MTKLRDLYDMLETLIEALFTGSIEIHFNKGGICKIVRHETIK